MPEKLKIEVKAANFFALPLKRVEIESVPETGRTYFVFEGRIVAALTMGQEDDVLDWIKDLIRDRAPASAFA